MRARTIALAASLVAPAMTALVGGCGKRSGEAPAPHASATASARAAASASASTVFASATASASAAPVGPGTSTFDAMGDACKPAQATLAEYLQHGELSVAGRDGAIATAWLVQIPNKPAAQIAFGGFDGEAKALARVRGIAAAKDTEPVLFASGDGWTVTWFDQQGLASARPRWEPLPAPEIEHLGAIGPEAADHVAVGATPSGALVAVAPFGADQTQLSVFLFAPVDAKAPRVNALGVTHHAKRPRRPAVAASASGYHLAWIDEGGRIAASFFDATGKETGDGDTLAPPSDAARTRLTLVPTDAGALALWQEGGTILARALDASAHPSGAITRVAEGRWASAVATKGGALVVLAGAAAADADAPLELLRVGADGKPAGKGLRVAAATKDPPALAMAGARIAIASTEAMGPGVATKRAVLRTIDAACVP